MLVESLLMSFCLDLFVDIFNFTIGSNQIEDNISTDSTKMYDFSCKADINCYMYFSFSF